MEETDILLQVCAHVLAHVIELAKWFYLLNKALLFQPLSYGSPGANMAPWPAWFPRDSPTWHKISCSQHSCAFPVRGHGLLLSKARVFLNFSPTGPGSVLWFRHNGVKLNIANKTSLVSFCKTKWCIVRGFHRPYCNFLLFLQGVANSLAKIWNTSSDHLKWLN